MLCKRESLSTGIDDESDVVLAGRADGMQERGKGVVSASTRANGDNACVDGSEPLAGALRADGASEVEDAPMS